MRLVDVRRRGLDQQLAGRVGDRQRALQLRAILAWQSRRKVGARHEQIAPERQVLGHRLERAAGIRYSGSASASR